MVRQFTIVALLGVLACSSIDPPRPVTLLVVNATCNAGQCERLTIRGLVGEAGLAVAYAASESLGVVSSDSACLLVPASLPYVQDTAATNQAPGTLVSLPDTVRWTAEDRMAFEASDSTSGGLRPAIGVLPDSATGWRITFPMPDSESRPTPSAACTPSS